MKKFIPTLALLLFVIIGKAQDISVSKGQEFIPENNAEFNYYIGNDPTGVYVRRTRTKGKGTTYLVQKLNPSNLSNILYSIDLDIDLKGRETMHSSFIKGTKIMVFTEDYVKEEGMKYFILREYNASNGVQITQPKKIAALQSDVGGVSGRNFFVSFSPDNSKLAIISEFKWSQKPSDVQVDI